MNDSDNKSSAIFILIIFFLLIISIFATYYKYIVREDFKYFTTEEEIPNQFSVDTYIQTP